MADSETIVTVAAVGFIGAFLWVREPGESAEETLQKMAFGFSVLTGIGGFEGETEVTETDESDDEQASDDGLGGLIE